MSDGESRREETAHSSFPEITHNGTPLGVGEPGEFSDGEGDSFDEFDIHSVLGESSRAAESRGPSAAAGLLAGGSAAGGASTIAEDPDEDADLDEDPTGADVSDDDDGDMQFLDPNNPLLKRAQEQLEKQLQETHDQLVLEIRGKKEESRRLAKQREEIGVELYRFQQQLAQAQEELDVQQETYEDMKDERQREEVKLERAKENNSVSEKALIEIKLTSEDHRREVNRLNGIIDRVKAHQDELISAIAINKREWFKGEGDVVNLEKGKLDQDLLLDQLTEQVVQKEDQAELIKRQIAAQVEESGYTQELLTEAQAAMEEVIRDKDALEHRWKQGLTAVQKRDQAVGEAEERVNHAIREARAVSVEIGNLKKEAENEQTKHELRTATFNRVSTESEFIEKKVAKAREARMVSEENLAKLTDLLEETDREAAQLEVQVRAVQTEVQHVKREGDSVVALTVDLDERIRSVIQQEKTLDRASQASQRAAKLIIAKVAEKQQDLAKLQNELSRLRVDQQHARSQNKTAKEELDEVIKELRERDELAERYETEIRRRSVEVERKQSEVDRLNKKLDSLKQARLDMMQGKVPGKMSEDNLIGPLEATIHNLQNEIEEVNQQCTGLQERWLRTQTEYVTLTNQQRQCAENCAALDHELTMLSQKALRLQTEATKHERDWSEIQKSEQQLRYDMERLQYEAGKRANLAHALEEGNLDLESALRDELQKAETEIAGMASKTENLSREHDDILHDIVEASRLVLLWEKKIALAKETTAAIDPSVGAAEVAEAKALITRLQAEFKAQKLRQRQLLVELDRSVARRTAVSVAGVDRKKQMAKGARQATARAQAKERDLTAKERTRKADIEELKRTVNIMQAEFNNIEDGLKEVTDEAQAVAREAEETQIMLKKAQMQRNEEFRAVTVYQQLARKYGDMVSAKDLQGRSRDPDEVTEKLGTVKESLEKQSAVQTDRAQKIKQALQSLEMEFPGHFAHVVGN